MENLVELKNGKVFVSSLCVADNFKKLHKNVLRDIENIECSNEFSQLNFELSDFTTERGKTYKCYNITKDGFAFLCMGFTGKDAAIWKEKYITAFNKMAGMLNSKPENEMLAINELTKKIKHDKDVASICGKELAKYKKIKKENKEKLEAEIKSIQVSLDI